MDREKFFPRNPDEYTNYIHYLYNSTPSLNFRKISSAIEANSVSDLAEALAVELGVVDVIIVPEKRGKGKKKNQVVKKHSVDILDSNGRSGLHHAALHHSKSCVEYLLKEGANPLLQSSHGLTPLEEALLSPKVQVKWGFETSAGHLVAKVREKDLSTPQYLADKSKDDLLRLAFKITKEGHLVPLVALLLVTSGTLINKIMKVDKALPKTTPKNILDSNETVDENRYLTLVDLIVEMAIFFGVAIRKKLGEVAAVNHGISPSGKMEKRGTALKMLECVFLFNPRISAHPQSSEPCALIRAAKANDGVVLGVFLDAKAPINELDSDRNNALHWALAKEPEELDTGIIRRLLEAGANILQGNNEGVTPVHTAAKHGHDEVLELFLEKEPSGANVLSGNKESPLHFSVKNNYLECTKILLSHGANRRVVNLANQRPGQLAWTSEMRAILGETELSAAPFGVDRFIQPKWDGNPTPATDESRLQPKLSICRYVGTLQGCSHGTNCRFAHSEDESLRLAGVKDGPEASVLYKTKLCTYYSRSGNCGNGDKCQFAHGDAELQPFRKTGKKESLVVEEEGDYTTCKLFVGGIPHQVNSNDLEQCFEDLFGCNLLEATIMETELGVSRGFGFIVFEDARFAELAVEQKWIGFEGKRMEVKRYAGKSTPAAAAAESKAAKHSTEEKRGPPPKPESPPPIPSPVALPSPPSPLPLASQTHSEAKEAKKWGKEQFSDPRPPYAPPSVRKDEREEAGSVPSTPSAPLHAAQALADETVGTRRPYTPPKLREEVGAAVVQSNSNTATPVPWNVVDPGLHSAEQVPKPSFDFSAAPSVLSAPHISLIPQNTFVGIPASIPQYSQVNNIYNGAPRFGTAYRPILNPSESLQMPPPQPPWDNHMRYNGMGQFQMGAIRYSPPVIPTQSVIPSWEQQYAAPLGQQRYSNHIERPQLDSSVSSQNGEFASPIKQPAGQEISSSSSTDEDDISGLLALLNPK